MFYRWDKKQISSCGLTLNLNAYIFIYFFFFNLDGKFDEGSSNIPGPEHKHILRAHINTQQPSIMSLVCQAATLSC